MSQVVDWYECPSCDWRGLSIEDLAVHAVAARHVAVGTNLGDQRETIILVPQSWLR